MTCLSHQNKVHVMSCASISQGFFNSPTINNDTQQFDEIEEQTIKQFENIAILPKNNSKGKQKGYSILAQKKGELEKACQEFEKAKKDLLKGIDLCEKSISIKNNNSLVFSEAPKGISSNIAFPCTEKNISNPPVEKGDGPDPYFPYARRINDWYSRTNENILRDNRYAWLSDPKYAKEREYLIQVIRITHTFGKALDPILVKLGTVFSGTSSSTRRYEENYCLPGELFLPQETSSRTGIYTLTKGDNGLFFHKYFSEKTEDELIQDYERKNIFKANTYQNGVPQPNQNERALSQQDDGSRVDHVCSRCITVKYAGGIYLRVFPFSGEVFQL